MSNPSPRFPLRTAPTYTAFINLTWPVLVLCGNKSLLWLVSLISQEWYEHAAGPWRKIKEMHASTKKKKGKTSSGTAKHEETSNCFPRVCDPVTPDDLPCSLTTAKPALIIDLVAHALAQHVLMSGLRCFASSYAHALSHLCYKTATYCPKKTELITKKEYM